MSSAVSSKPSSTHIDKKSKSNTSISAADAPSRNLRRAFRSFASALIVAARQAEKKVDGTNDDSKPSSKDDNKSSDKTKVEEKKDALQTSVETILKLRQTLRTTATKLEDRLRGNIRESEALQCCLKSQACVVGGRKRKFAYLDNKSS